MRKKFFIASFLILLTGLTSCSLNSEKTGEFYLRRGTYNGHNDEAFASIGVITDGNKIYDVSIDEYQYTEENEAIKQVPSSDGEFKNGAKDKLILFSKNENEKVYSELMKEYGKSTISLNKNYKALENFVKGKTIKELQNLIKEKNDSIVDEISECTLLSSKVYIEDIIKAARNDKMQVKGKADDINNVKLKRIIGQPHDDRSFGEVFSVTEGEKILAASIDEYCYFEGDSVVTADSKFNENYKDVPLISKRRNNEKYSKLMKEYAKSTKTITQNYEDMENYVKDKTIEEIKTQVDKKVDGISGATLVDENGYLKLILDSAKE